MPPSEPEPPAVAAQSPRADGQVVAVAVALLEAAALLAATRRMASWNPLRPLHAALTRSAPAYDRQLRGGRLSMSTSNRPKGAAVGLEQFKRAQRQVWEEGDYRPVGRLLEHAAHILVDRAAVTPGQRVLDVATGSGTVAIAAAQAGGNVLGIDITDAWFDDARQAAVQAGVDLQLEVGDAEDLPVADAAFDVVLSGFGAIFAPRHEVVAAELTRACRPGGTIAFTAWTPGGKNDRMFSVLSDYLPAPPDFVTPYIRWGDPEHVRAVFAPQRLPSPSSGQP